MTDDSSRFATNLKRLRLQSGLSQAALSQETGISPGYLSELENSSGKIPSVEKVRLIAGVLGVSIEELLGQPRPDGVLPPSLDEFARIAKLRPAERDQLASIKFHRNPPTTVKRWSSIWEVMARSESEESRDVENEDPRVSNVTNSVTPETLFVGTPLFDNDQILDEQNLVLKDVWRDVLKDDDELVKWFSTLGWESRATSNGAEGTFITRRQVLDISRSAGDSVERLWESLFAVFVWGAQSDRRSIHRARKVLNLRHDHETMYLLRKAKVRLQENSKNSARAAYEILVGQTSSKRTLNREDKNPVRESGIEGLGPVFASRFLYFNGYRHGSESHDEGAGAPALSLDLHIAESLEELTGQAWSRRYPWTSSQYQEYLDLAATWANSWRDNMKFFDAQKGISSYAVESCLSNLSRDRTNELENLSKRIERGIERSRNPYSFLKKD